VKVASQYNDFGTKSETKKQQLFHGVSAYKAVVKDSNKKSMSVFMKK